MRGYVERGVAVLDGSAGLDPGNLAIEVACRDAGPAFSSNASNCRGNDPPDRFLIRLMSRRGSGGGNHPIFATGHGRDSGKDGFRGLAFLQGGNDRMGTMIGGHITTLSSIAGAICRDAANFLALRDPARKLRQHRRVADMAPIGRPRGPSGSARRSRHVSCTVSHVAPSVRATMANAPLRAAMLAGRPSAFARDLDASAVDRQVQWPIEATMRDVDGAPSAGLRGPNEATTPFRSGGKTAC